MRLCRVIALVSACVAAHAQILSTTTAASAVDAAHAAGNFDGIVIIAQDGKVLLSKAVGMADRERSIPLGPGTVFRLASLTKQVTALLVMQQVAAGTMRLDEPASTILPSLAPTTGRVTVQQLLQHISGLPNPSDGPDGTVPAFYTRTHVGPGYMQTTATGFCSGKPKRNPDESFEYNNCDYIVLGALLEKVAGMPYARLLETKVSEELHLTTWGIYSGAATPSKVKAYTADGKLETPQNPASYAAAGALYGSALDVATWNEALMTNKLLPKAETDIMFHGENTLGGEALGSWSYDVPGFTPALHVVERQGDIGSVRVLSLLVPATHTSIVILANTDRADLFNTYSKQGLGYALLKSLQIPVPPQ